MPFPLPSREWSANQRAGRARAGAVLLCVLAAGAVAVLGAMLAALGLL